jgi:hypothetical protein
MSRFVFSSLVLLVSSSSASAVTFANQVVGYTPGAGVGGYANPSAALGGPDPITGVSFGFPNVLSPFSPAYETDEIVRVGEGGSITLRMASPVAVGAGAEFGLIENVTLFDPAYPSGTTSDPAFVFSDDSALVEVSSDGTTFVGLGGSTASSVSFNMPAVYFLNAGAFDTTSPSVPLLSDFGKPFTPAGGLAAFDGKTSYADVVNVFEGSGGGTWFDASASGLTTIQFLRFTVPDDQNPTTTNTLEIDALMANSALVVPEPAAMLTTPIIASMALRRRR